ncbi:hypothetical protein AC152_25405 [Salmonella enterica]|nr:hypothetical protein [Salmonella enterica]EBN6690260.1 hypothetical protein [Salmonella enterica]EIY7074136.1 hypothetical protein [Salmonella enterica]
MKTGFICRGVLLGVKPRDFEKDGKTFTFYSLGVQTEVINDFGIADTKTELLNIPFGDEIQKTVNYYNSLKGKMVEAFLVTRQYTTKSGAQAKSIDVSTVIECKSDK